MDECNQIERNIPKQDRYPICNKCLNNLIFKVKDSKVLLYCDKCYMSKTIPIDSNILNSAFSANFIDSNYSQQIECKKCKQIYCSECYINHEDIVIACDLENIQSSEKVFSRTLKHQEKYSYYKINCDKCGKKFSSGIIKEKINIHKSIREIKKDLLQGKKYVDDYYVNLKRKIITELNEKIELIEERFQANYEFHQNYFSLLDKLLLFYQEVPLDKILKSLNNLSCFTFPTIDTNNINDINVKVNAISDFYYHKFIIPEQEKGVIKSINKIEEKVSDYCKLIQLSDKKLLLSFQNTITIYNQYNFQPEIIITNPFRESDIKCLAQIDKNTLLLSTTNLHLCFYDNKNNYSFKKFPIKLNCIDMICIKNKKIVLSSFQECLIVTCQPPYKIIKKIKVNYLRFVYELSDGRLFLATRNKEHQYLLSICDYKHLETIKAIESDIKNINHLGTPSELNNKNIVLSEDNCLIIINPFTYQIETKIYLSKEVSLSKTVHINNCIAVISDTSIDIISVHTFQIVLSINHQLSSNILDCCLLGNGTLLLISCLDETNYEDIESEHSENDFN